MRVLNDFTCESCGVTKEHFVDSSITSVRCDCGGEATKELKAPMFKEKTNGRHVTGKALDRWERKRDRVLKQERKASPE